MLNWERVTAIGMGSAFTVPTSVHVEDMGGAVAPMYANSLYPVHFLSSPIIFHINWMSPLTSEARTLGKQSLSGLSLFSSNAVILAPPDIICWYWSFRSPTEIMGGGIGKLDP